jgi:dienelactone hydrolase
MSRTLHTRSFALLVLLAASLLCFPGAAPRVLPEGQTTGDRRHQPLKTLNDYFPFNPAATPDEWAARADGLRRQLQVATGLWPMPTAAPANAVIHGRIERDGYTVEKVFFESFPGHFVTGNLYRPTGHAGKRPAVLCPHGHWPNGRFYDAGEAQIRNDITAGAERFDPSGRYPLQARSATLARLGCVVFHYDMIGYADSVQLEHRAGARAAMNTPKNWGYFSPQAEARLQTLMGLQTYNSIRALDWLLTLPEVDPERIGVTGASGGGTQTFILAAVDPRPTVAFPAVMVSTAMQGGCTCENACYLRLGTGNVEIAGLFAPKPLGLTAADDWTKDMPTRGWPELREHYRMLGAEDHVSLAALIQFPHNYNYQSRAAMYQWMNRHLNLGHAEPVVEQDFEPVPPEQLSVWDDAHPKPTGGDDYERSLVRWISEDSDRQMAALVPNDAASLARYREIVGGAVDVMIGRRLPAAAEVEATHRRDDNREGYRLSTLLLQNRGAGEAVPAVLLAPEQGRGAAVVWVDRGGKQSMFDDQGNPRPAIRRLLDAGSTVIGIDLMGQGEQTADGQPLARQRLNASGQDAWAAYAGYTFGYNHSLFAQRVHDILSAVAWLRQTPGIERVQIAGLNGAGHWAAAALVASGDAAERAAIDTGGFRFAALTTLDDPDFLPGGAKYLDLPGVVALAAPHALWLSGETPATTTVVTAAYQAAGQPDKLSLCEGSAEEEEAAAVEWLLH